MLQLLKVSRVLGFVLFGAAFAAGCGDSIDTGTFPRIALEIDSQPVSNEDVVYYGQAIQQVIAKTVTVGNVGTKVLKISSIDWAKDDAGAKLKNQYVEIDWRGSIDANSFPYEIDTGNLKKLTFAVEFTPPLGRALDDFSPSVLVIKSNALDDLGRQKVEEFRITFSMRQDLAYPRVTPINYRFQNATLAKPESQEFRIYNDDQLATASFRILAVRLETPSQEFTLGGTPSAGTVVLEPGNGGYEDVVFTVTYQPKDNLPDTNAIIIETDVGSSGTLRVPLTTGTTLGSYSLSYSHQDELDFSNVTTKETRSVLISSDGPGPITIKEPHIEPSDARRDFKLTAWIPKTSEAGQDTQITSWPRGLNVGKTLRLDIEYSPQTERDTANGQIIVPFENPNPGEISIDIFSGDPKSKIVLAPATGNVSVTGSAVNGDTGTRKVVIYNEGNGPLEVSAAVVKADFDLPPKVWSLPAAFSALTIEPGGVRSIEVAYDLSKISTQSGRVAEYLELTYYDDFTGQSEKKTLGLIAENSGGKANPVASLGQASDYAGATVATALTLSGSGSTAASGTIDANAYVYYLTAKPAGSYARLNAQTGASATFVPDVAGSYTIELVVYAKDGDYYLFSAPATVTITVAP